MTFSEVMSIGDGKGAGQQSRWWITAQQIAGDKNYIGAH